MFSLLLATEIRIKENPRKKCQIKKNETLKKNEHN